MSKTLLIHHAANRGHGHPANSLRSLQICLEAGARVVEVDVTPTSGGDFALLHDGVLDNSTNGMGSVFSATAEQVCKLQYTRQGAVTNEKVGILSQAVSLIQKYTCLQELQIDFKQHVPLTDAVLNDLLRVIKPVKERVRVTSIADWALRRLRVLDNDLLLGFDPLLYLDVEMEGERDEINLPFRKNAYGYLDDHPLGSHRGETPADYLAARAESLIAQSPPDIIWYINVRLLANALNDGFDWIAYLHKRGFQVDAWTLNPDQREQVILARRLVEVGIDRITTNDAPRLAIALGDSVTL